MSEEYIVRFQHRADIKGVKQRMLRAVGSVAILNQIGRVGPQMTPRQIPHDCKTGSPWSISDDPLDLLKAVRLQNVPQVRHLLGKGSPSNGVDNKDGIHKKFTPLVAACSMGHVIITQLLLNHSASTALAIEGGITPLHAACNACAIACCQILVAQGADVDAAADDGKRPLHYACAVGAAKCAEILLRAGADVEEQTPEGELPIHTLCINVEMNMPTQMPCRAKKGFETIDFVACAEILVDAGSPLEKKFKGRRAIQYAAHNSSADIVATLISAGARPLSKKATNSTGGRDRRAL